MTAEWRDLKEGVSEPQAEDTASAKALRWRALGMAVRSVGWREGVS